MLHFILAFISFVFLVSFFCLLYLFLRKYERRNIYCSLLVSIIIVQVFKWGFIDITRVPSSSMEQTLIPGDFVVISKFHYGARTPSTILQIPLTHQETKFFGLKSYLDWIQIPFFRFPGFSRIKTNDIVVFNTPSESNIPMDVRKFYVKRCIGLPGDYLKMVNGTCYANGKEVPNAPDKKFKFILKSKSVLRKKWFVLNNIFEYVFLFEDKNGYKFYSIVILNKTGIEATLKKIRNDRDVVSVELESFIPDEFVFVGLFEGYKNIVNWGGENGILIPKRGLKIKLDESNIMKYWTYIERECGKNIEKRGNLVYLNGNRIDDYVFKYDYYFMIGDNIFNSFDSRYWGFVREDEIYAKPLFILFSKSEESLLGGFKFRFFKFL